MRRGGQAFGFLGRIVEEGLDTERSSSGPERFGPPWLTVEFGLYMLLVLAAALLRFYALGSQPLDENEARLALDTWRFYMGGAAGIRGHSPLLFHGNTVLFGLFGGGDGVARLLPALTGTALVGLPYLLRSSLGRRGALVSAAILTFSPSFVFFSRQLQGEIIVPACSLLVLAGVFGYMEQGRPYYAYLVAGALGLCLMVGGGTYAMVLALGGFLLGVVLYSRVSGRGWPWLGVGAGPVDGLFLVGSRQTWLRAGGLFAAITLLVSTGLFVNLQGLQAALDLLPAWLGQFSSLAGAQPWNYYLSLLLAYELPVLVFGLAGAWYLARRDLFCTLLVCWFGVSLVLYSLMGTKPPSGVLHALLPLSLLAGKTIAELLSKIGRRERLAWDRLVLLVSIPAVAYILLQLAAFANRQNPGDPRHLILILMSVFTLACVILISGALAQEWGDTLRAGGLVLLATLAALTVQGTWRLNYYRPGNPFESLVQRPTSPDVRNLVRALEEFSDQSEGDRHSVDVTVTGGEDVLLAWYLREFPDLTFRSGVGEPLTSAIVTPLGEALPSRDYLGQRFRLQSSWQAEPLVGHTLVGWYFYREALSPPVQREAVMWVPIELE